MVMAIQMAIFYFTAKSWAYYILYIRGSLCEDNFKQKVGQIFHL